MSYKTLLCILRDEDHVARQVADAAVLARRFDAHVDFLCLGIDAVQVGYYFAGADAVVQQTSVALARENAEAIDGAVGPRASAAGLRWTSQVCVAQFGALGAIVAQAARFADLVLLAPRDGDSDTSEADAVLEAAIFTGDAAVLLPPRGGLSEAFPLRPLVAWNDGAEALAAVRAALPAMAAAGQANIAVVDPPRRAAGAPAPGASLATMLDRHGIRPELSVLARDQPRVSDILVEQVRALDADLLIAGAYGHSRFREAILGGATRDLLERAPVALLMAH